jgi:hypothetical protein
VLAVIFMVIFAYNVSLDLNSSDTLLGCPTLFAEPYRRALVKAAAKSMEGGSFPLLVVDAPHARAEHLREVWVAGQKAGYEVIVVEPLSGNPQVSGGHCWVTLICTVALCNPAVMRGAPLNGPSPRMCSPNACSCADAIPLSWLLDQQC